MWVKASNQNGSSLSVPFRRLEAAVRSCEERLSNVEVLGREGLTEARGAAEAAERGQEQLQGTEQRLAQELKAIRAYHVYTLLCSISNIFI